jgi:hypothetical protein
VLTVCADQDEVERQLGSGGLACPSSSGVLAGWARVRRVRGLGGVVRRVRPRRAACRGCGRTHVLLPVTLLARRYDEAAVIGMALEAKAAGAGHRPIAGMLGCPASDTKENAAAFGYSGAGPDDPGRAAFPKARVVTVSECATHAVADAEIGGVAGKGAGEQSLARRLYRRLEEDWLLIAGRNFYNWADWCTAADSGAALLWRVKANLTLPVLELLPDGSYSSVLVSPKASGKARQQLTGAARAGEDLDEDQARYVRVIEYEVPDRDGDGKGEVIALITTITEMTAAPAPLLAQAYHQRWEHETGNAQLKTHLRGPGRVLRSKSPDMVRQEIYGYLLTHYAISALICRAATEADIDPDRVKFKQTVRIIRRQAAGPAAFPP